MTTAKFKLIILGSEGVGKSSLIEQFIYSQFKSSYNPSIGIDFISKTVDLDSKTVRLQIWDTAGQKRFQSLFPSYLQDSSAAVIVYAIDNIESFHKVSEFIQLVKNEREDEIFITLVGNKLDLSEKRQVSTTEGENKAKEYNVRFIETSAKDGCNVIPLFKELASMTPDFAIQHNVKNQSFESGLVVSSSSKVPNKSSENESAISRSSKSKNKKTSHICQVL